MGVHIFHQPAVGQPGGSSIGHSREAGQREFEQHEYGPHEFGQREFGKREFAFVFEKVVLPVVRVSTHRLCARTAQNQRRPRLSVSSHGGTRMRIQKLELIWEISLANYCCFESIADGSVLIDCRLEIHRSKYLDLSISFALTSPL